MRASRFAALLSLFLLIGCNHKSTTRPDTTRRLPAGTPAADTPEHLVTRLEATFDTRVPSEYSLLLADDFRFHFSSASDPNLVAQYGDNWTRPMDALSMNHLCDGFTNSTGDAIPAANAVAMTNTGLGFVDDPDHPDSTAHYRKVTVAAMSLVIDVPSSPDPVRYQVSSAGELYLVRGDAAVLDAGRPATSAHWYVRRWDDLATPGFGAPKAPAIHPSNTTTLGKIKSLYL